MMSPPVYQERAYCVATLDTRVDPPVVVHVGIYSAPAHSLTSELSGKSCNVDVTSAYGDSYAHAADELRTQLKTYRQFAWTHPWIFERRGH